MDLKMKYSGLPQIVNVGKPALSRKWIPNQ
jgi:hypothetical protein